MTLAAESPEQTVRVSLPFPWDQGQHLAIIGDTGTGKTYLAARILQTQPFVLSLKSKADNTRIPGRIIRSADDLTDIRNDRFTLYPNYERQGQQFVAALERVWKEGGWTVYLDELFYLDRLKITHWIDRLYTQGRSKGITVASGMQRPVGVTRFAISQATHIIAFRQEGRDVKTLREIGGENLAEALSDPIMNKPHAFVWYHRPSRRTWIGRAQDLEKGA